MASSSNFVLFNVFVCPLPLMMASRGRWYSTWYGQGLCIVSGRVHKDMMAWSGMGGDGASEGPVSEAHADTRLKMHCYMATISTCFSFNSSGEEEITAVVQGG